MIRTITACCKKYIQSPYFLLSVLCVAAACLLNVAYTDGPDAEYSVLQAIMQICGGKISTEEKDISVLGIFNSSLGESTLMLIPILAAVPFAVPVCAERQSGNLRLILHRTGRWAFCAAKLLAAIVSGGLMLVVGYLLYDVLLLPFFPLQSVWEPLTGVAALVTFLQRLIGLFCFGGGSVIAAYLLTFFTSNLYLVLCIPFLLNYLLNYMVEWLGIFFFNIYDNPVLFVEPSCLQGVGYLTRNGLKSLGFYCILAVLCLLAGGWLMGKKADCSE